MRANILAISIGKSVAIAFLLLPFLAPELLAIATYAYSQSQILDFTIWVNSLLLAQCPVWSEKRTSRILSSR